MKERKTERNTGRQTERKKERRKDGNKEEGTGVEGKEDKNETEEDQISRLIEICSTHHVCQFVISFRRSREIIIYYIVLKTRSPWDSLGLTCL